MASLTVLKGANQGTTLPLEGDQIILGRNVECQVVINLPAVSREHALIRKVQNQYWIEDLKSRNGTQINSLDIKKSTLLKHNDKIKICDNIFEFQEKVARPPLPPDLTGLRPPLEEEGEDNSSSVEATISQGSKQILETQPAEKLAVLLGIAADLTQTIYQDQLLPKIVDSLFRVFKQADRGFVIFHEEDPDRLVPKVIRTRRAHEETTARFSRGIIRKCLETGQALLSEDASADKQFDLSQSIADCRIRSVMCAPLTMLSTGKVFGVIQVDTQERSKKFTQDDLKLLLAVAGQASIAVENARLHQTSIANASMERDLRLAHQVQLSFLPKRLPQITGYEFYAHYEPALEVGGDYYDFIPLSQNRLGVMVGDVAGKGVPAALLMAKVSSDARFSMLTEAGIAEAVFKLNDLMQEAALLDRFVTLAAGLLDPNHHEVTFVNAGHLPPLICRSSLRKVEEAVDHKLAGFPLGVAEGIPYSCMTIPLQPGDSVVVFTDGITEAKNKQELEFQMQSVVKILQNGPFNAKTLGERLVAAVKKHALGCKPHDDITVVCFGRSG